MDTGILYVAQIYLYLCRVFQKWPLKIRGLIVLLAVCVFIDMVDSYRKYRRGLNRRIDAFSLGGGHV